MRTFLTNAFAVGRLAEIQEFHLSLCSTYVPEPSLLIITSGRPETNKQRREALFHYSMHRDPQACQACLKHSPFLKVNVTGHLATGPGTQRRQRVSPIGPANPDRPATRPLEARHRHRRRPYHDPADTGRSSNPTTSFLTAAMLIYAIGAGVTAAAGTRLALQWVLVKRFKIVSFRERSL
jgi:hypothetical protein